MNQSASYLTAWLEEQDMLQGKFAELLGVSEPTMSRILRGTQIPTIERALKIERLTHGRVTVAGWAIPFVKEVAA